MPQMPTKVSCVCLEGFWQSIVLPSTERRSHFDFSGGHTLLADAKGYIDRRYEPLNLLAIYMPFMS